MQAEMLNSEYTISNLKHEGNADMLRIVSEHKPTENAVQTEPTLEDLYLFYFSEEKSVMERKRRSTSENRERNN
jgi:ABC-2 type transport system ATP-binding protein